MNENLSAAELMDADDDFVGMDDEWLDAADEQEYDYEYENEMLWAEAEAEAQAAFYDYEPSPYFGDYSEM